MIKQAVRVALWPVVIALSTTPADAGDSFVTPRLECQAGYEHNRLAESDGGAGTPFWQTSPGLDLTVFGEETELSVLLDYRHTQYARSGLESKDESSAFAQWRHFHGPNEVGASVGGGSYADLALPDDDSFFWQASSYGIRTLDGVPVELSLKATFRQTFYDADASGTDRDDSRLDVRPGLRWHMCRRVTVWTELYAERNASSAPDAGYSGLGAAVGCEVRPAARLAAGAWAQVGTRPYDERVDGASRNDTPGRVGGWASYRLRPGLELFTSATWASFASTVAANDYSWWQTGAGVRLSFEHQLRRR